MSVRALVVHEVNEPKGCCACVFLERSANPPAEDPSHRDRFVVGVMLFGYGAPCLDLCSKHTEMLRHAIRNVGGYEMPSPAPEGTVH